MTERKLLTVREYALEARVTERTIRRWINEGGCAPFAKAKNLIRGGVGCDSA